jgi:hypothetical protein
VKPLLDRMLSLAGGDPAVFRPVARAQALLVKRRSRLAITRGALGKMSPFRMLCFFAALYGVVSMTFAVLSRAPMVGLAAAAAIGCVFLLLVVFTDYLDVLVDPREYLVLAAHPHDGRSLLLAKVAVVGRNLFILSVWLFTPTAVGLALGGNGGTPAQGAAFLVGAFAAGAAASMAGLFVGVAILTLGGRALMERVLPFVQVGFQIAYVLVIGGQSLMRGLRAESVPASLPWLLPTFWFLAPLEALRVGLSAGVWARVALAAAATVFLVVGVTRWLGAHLGERLLEPIQRATSPARRPSVSRRRRVGRFGSTATRQIFELLRIHLRSDWKTRSEFLLMPLTGIFLILFYTRGPASVVLGSGFVTFFFGWFLLLAVDVLTRSSRPGVLWCVLVAPIDRAKLSFAAISLVRWFQLLPLAALLVGLEVFTGEGTPLPRALRLAELIAFGDLLILIGRGMAPDFPFSRPSRSEGRDAGRRTVLMLFGGLAAGIGTAIVAVSGRFGMAGAAAGAAILLAARVPATAWTRRRVAAAAVGLELTEIRSG